MDNSEEKSEKQIPGSNIPEDDEIGKGDENISELPGPGEEKQIPVETGKQEVSPALINEVSDSQNDLQSSTKDMEVHHHPHVHHSKPWKNYLFEFLMLFLAVLAGFFVENKRELYVEQHRADQFSRQLLADLRLDSIMFEKRNRDIENMQKGYDSLLYLLTKKTGATPKEILEILLPITFVFDMPATTSTYNQMKTSGALRYIENTKLTAHLQQYYDVLLPRSIKLADASLIYFSENINPFYLKHIRIQDYDPYNDTLVNKSPVLLNTNSETNQELANIMGGYRSILKILAVTMNAPALEKIKETIVILKEEYGLE